MDEQLSFGAWLQRRRKTLDLTQAELAKRVGCALGTIRKLETDERRPSKQVAARLADQLQLAPEERALFLKVARAERGVEHLAPPTRLLPELPVDPATLPRGTVTFLFTDIEGSSQLWEQHPQTMPQALARHEAILRSSIRAYGGAVFKTVGDAMCAAFARAPAALTAALEAQRALQAEVWGPCGALRVRMALHTGAAEEQAADYQGPPLNRVARLLACGHGGQVLLSLASEELVREQLPPEVELRPLGEHRLKGLSLPEQIFQLVAPGLRADFPPLASLERRRANLPLQPTPLIGREREVAAVSALLARPEVRLLTLTGPGGVGKTRLATQVAAELLDGKLPLAAQQARVPDGEGGFANGIYFVNLAPLSDPALVAATIAQTLEVRESAGQPLLETLRAHLREKRLLLLLDNFEQVLEAAPTVAALLGAAPGLKLLVTSRAALHLAAEQEYPVPPLQMPAPTRLPPLEQLTQYAAVRLFVERALAVKPDFAVTNANAPAVAEICSRLDGLPLALELAAARSKLLPPEALLKQLERRFSVLTGGPRDLPARQQTLRNTIDWSYQLLPPETQALFRRLAVFVGGCTLEAAEAVCAMRSGAEAEQVVDREAEAVPVLDGLDALVDQSLLRQVEGPAGEPRLAMLETIREYALERLEHSGEAEAMRQRHARFFLSLAQEAAPQSHGRRRLVWLERLEADHDNCQAALAWALAGGQTEVVVQLAAGLAWFWKIRGYASEGRRWLEAALGQSHRLPVAVRAMALSTIAGLASNQSDYVQAQMLYDASLALWRELGNQEQIAATLFDLGELAYFQSDRAQAATLLTESLALFGAQDNQPRIAITLKRLGALALDEGDYPRAAALLEDGLTRFHDEGNKVGIADSLHILSIMARLQGDYARALALEEESLALCRELSVKGLTAMVLISLGYIALRQGGAAQARAYFVESLAIGREAGDQRGPVLCLAGLAGVAGIQGLPSRAARLFGAAEALIEVFQQRPGGNHRIEQERNVALVRVQLDEATFAAAWEAGRALSLEQALAEATAEEA